MKLATTLITDDPRKLPPDYARLVDLQQPLPPTVRFFEERKTWGSSLKRLGLSLFFVVLGLALIASDLIAAQTVGEIGLFLTLIGLTCWFAAFLLLLLVLV